VTVRTTRTWIAAGLVGMGMATSTLALMPSAGADGPRSDALAQVRDATARYRRVDRAVDDGYVQFFGCVHEPLAGSMGIHFVKPALAGDGLVDPAAPEALMYEQRPNGTLELTGAEYVVFAEAWDAAHDAPPSLFGQTFTLVASPNRYGLPPFYELHAWAWKANPAGAHADWNPSVLCTGAEGHVH
jgi:hypothetical protein